MPDRDGAMTYSEIRIAWTADRKRISELEKGLRELAVMGCGNRDCIGPCLPHEHATEYQCDRCRKHRALLGDDDGN